MAMNKIEMIQYLIDEIKAEQILFQKYNETKKKARRDAEKAGESYWRHFEWEERLPTKSRIEDNCKLARRLLLEVSKER